jgi:hypothetical protein
MKSVLFLIILVGITQCNRHKELSGVVRAKDSKLPIEDCHVYINKSIGTVTNKNGEFTLLIPKQKSNGSLIVSHLEFEKYIISIDKLKPNQLIELNEATILLREIIIRPEKKEVSENSGL